MNDPPTSHQTPSSTTDYEHAIGDSVRSDDIDRSNREDIDYSIRTNQIFDESTRSGNYDVRNDSFFKSDYGLESVASNDPHVQYSYDQTTASYQTCKYESDQSDFFESEDDDDDSTDQYVEYDETDFPPGHITTLSEMEDLQSRRRKSTNVIDSNSCTDVNPSVLPTYFFCPITQCIMQDPVLTPDGNTFERRALLRYMVIHSCDPLTGRALSLEEIKNDDLVRGKIEKCRREAWVRYVMSIDGGGVIGAEDSAHRSPPEDEASEVESDDRELNITKSNSNEDSDGSNYSDEIQDLLLTNTSSSARPNFLETYNPENALFGGFITASNNNKDIQKSDASTASSSQPKAANIHGWNTPLGVHRIICKPPGLLVTSDYHRRSSVVKRKVFVKKTNSKMKKDKDIDAQTVPFRGRNVMGKMSPKKKKNSNLTVVSRDLILKRGSHVDIVETIVHGGRVRGKIVWEEEMIVELDDALLAQMNARYMGEHEEKQTDINSKKRTSFFRRQNNKSKSISTDLFTESPNVHVRSECSPSPPPLTLTKCSGWISLEWAGNNNEREETIARRLHSKEELASDEDDGPWSQPLPLGVYSVHCESTVYHDQYTASSGQLSLSDAADSDRNITHLLVENQYVEIVEMQVVVMKSKITNDHYRNRHFGMNAADGFCGVRTVRCRCIVPILINPTSNNARPQKKFSSGWMSLCTDNRLMETKATPLQQGAYIIVSNSGCIVTEGNGSDSKIKSILPRNSCVEVVTTQLRFEENEELLKCQCGREVMRTVAAVRALIASGGYITLLYSPIGTSELPGNICNCGTLIQYTIAEPVPIGMYRICHPNGVIVTSGIKESQTVSIIDEGKSVEVLQTVVEDHCIRGRISLEDDHLKETIIGWISLFEFPETRWAEFIRK